MQTSSDSSIWRSLAVAFGDGLAFGVGVKLSQNAARHRAAGASADAIGLSDRVMQIEESLKRIERAPAAAGAIPGGMDQKVLEVIVAALEARLKEQAGVVDRRLADLDAKVTIELKSLDDQDHQAARQLAQDLSALQEQMVSVNREFGEAVGQIVAEQVASQVEARAAALDRSMERRVAAVVEVLAQPMEQRLAQMVGARLEPIERRLGEEVGQKDRELAELRLRVQQMDSEMESRLAVKDREIAELTGKLTAADTNLFEIVAGIGQVCRAAAERLGPVSTPAAGDSAQADATEMDAGLEAAADASGETPVPGFAQQQKPNRLWRVPLVSSMVVALTGGLFLAHYL